MEQNRFIQTNKKNVLRRDILRILVAVIQRFDVKKVSFTLKFRHLFICMSLKLMSAIFYQIFIFHQMIALQKLLKMLFISSKKLFSFLRYLNFFISFFPSFFPVSQIKLFSKKEVLLRWLKSGDFIILFSLCFQCI